MPDQAYFDLLNACEQPGCPVCRLVATSTKGYLESLFYESVNDRELRAQLRLSRGFCSEHAWLALETGTGDALGVAIIYHDVLGNILRDLPSMKIAGQDGLANFLGQVPRQLSAAIKAAIAALIPQAPCPACQARDNATGLVLSILLENMQDERLSTSLASSTGLCLPHLRLALEQVRDGQDFNDLMSLHMAKLQGLRDELAELIRKNDYRFKHEALGAERDAWRRAVAQVVGWHPLKRG